MIDHLELALAIIIMVGLAYMAWEIYKADRKRPDDWDDFTPSQKRFFEQPWPKERGNFFEQDGD